MKQNGRPKKVPKKLRDHLITVCNEVRWLVHFNEIAWQFREIVKRFPEEVYSDFWDFAGWAHGGELVHRIDRLCEDQWSSKKRKVLSFVAFLQDLKPHAHFVNREDFVGVVPNTEEQYVTKHPGRLKPPDTFLFHHQNRFFDKAVGKTKFSLTPAYIDRDIRRIKSATRRINKYRNKHLAHMAADRLKFKPASMNDVANAITLLRRLVNKYAALVNNHSDSLEFGTVDITDAFMQPWISSAAIQTELVTQFKEHLRAERDKMYTDKKSPKSKANGS